MMNFLRDAVFVTLTDTMVNLLTAVLSVPINLLTQWLGTLLGTGA